MGKVYLHAVMDTYSSFAFGFLHISKQPQAAVAVLHSEALPFYSESSLKVENVLTDNGEGSSVEVRDTPTKSTWP